MSQEDRVSPDQTMRPAKRRVGVGRSPLFGELAALLLIALGVVGVQEAVVRTGVTGAPSWTSATLQWVQSLVPAFWMVVAGVVAVLIGLWALLTAVRPRPRTTSVLEAGTAVEIRSTDLARVAAAHIDGLDGVTDVGVTSTRRRVDVRVTTLAGKDANAALRSDAEQQLLRSLSALTKPPRVRVRVRNEDLA